MTKTETLIKIREKIKPYVELKIPQSTYSYRLLQIEKGLATAKLEQVFFRQLGFVMTKEAEYEENDLNKIKL